jgi:hypothetical protein
MIHRKMHGLSATADRRVVKRQNFWPIEPALASASGMAREFQGIILADRYRMPQVRRLCGAQTVTVTSAPLDCRF